MALYTREMDTDVVNRILENPHIQTQTPTAELATKQTTQAMMQDMVKGSNSLIPQTTFEGTLAQFTTAYSSLPNTTPELSEQFSELFRQFVKGLMDIIQRQGLTNGLPDA